MKTFHCYLYLLTLVLLSVISCSKDENSSPVLDRRDATFMVAAAQIHVSEITFSKLADSLSATAAVRAFAQKMITEHQGALDELLGIARDKTLGLEQEMDSAHKVQYPKLGVLRGLALDTAYLKGQSRDYEQAEATFRFQADSGYDTPLKTYAAKCLPMIQRHKKQADSLIVLSPQ